MCDETGKKVTINSKETLEVVKFVAALYKEAMDARGVVLGRRRQQPLPGLGPRLAGSTTRSRPTARSRSRTRSWPTRSSCGRRRPGRCAGWSPARQTPTSIWNFARNKDAALEFLRYYAENWVEGFKASTGYNHPIFANVVPKPMPILSNDPSSHPPDKLKVLETANEWHAVFGYPGPAGPAPDEVANAFIIPDMMASAATDKMTPEEAVAWAEKQIHGIYKKWMA